MLIQNSNTNGSVQIAQPPRPPGEGLPKTAPGTGVQPGAAAELPQKAIKQASAQQPSAEELKKVVEALNQVLRQSNHSLEFSVDSDTHRPIVKLLDTETGELIRQFPSEETLAISRAIGEFQQGMLLRQEA